MDSVSLFWEATTNLRILVVGDVMLDRYLWGGVSRISPEAPVPVVDVRQEENRPGGAANVASNLAALGTTPILAGIVGFDKEGNDFIETLSLNQLNTNGIIKSNQRRTTSKIRIIGNQQHLLRVDKEDRYPLSNQELEDFRPLVFDLLAQCDALLFEDYDKGLLSQDIIQALTQQANNTNKPVIVDPKFKNFWHYAGSSCFKPNLKELSEGVGIPLRNGDIPAIQDAVLLLRKKMPHKYTVVTLSENGMLCCDENDHFRHIPAHFRKIVDVSGAGDTVVSVLTLAIAVGLPIYQATQLANLAGGIVCEEVGVVAIDKNKLYQEYSKNFTEKK